MRLPCSFAAIAFGEFNFAVRAAGLFHLLDRVVHLQLSLRALLQFTVNSLVVGIQFVSKRSASAGRATTLSNNKGIIPERFKEFAQHLGLFGVLRHALHFSL